MAYSNYHEIDKNIIEEGVKFGFGVFIYSSSNKKMVCFKEKELPITSDEKNIIYSTNVLYVAKSDYKEYEQFLHTRIVNALKVEDKSFEEKSSIIFNNASQVLHNLFKYPEALGNYEASKEIVCDMVSIILDNHFTIKSLMSIAEHDYYTHTHSIHVAIYSLSLGSFLGLEQNELSELGEAALLHDLGKSKIKYEIINKNGKLTDAEFDTIKKHSIFGYELGIKLGITNKNVLLGIKHHHEKIDGSGYPSGIRNENIPYYAKIIGVCDIFDALTSRRSYKEAMTTFEALKLMKDNMKNHIDPKLLNKMIEMFISGK